MVDELARTLSVHLVGQPEHPRHSQSYDSFPLLVSTEPDCDSAHTQQFSDYLSLFQVGNECDEGRHVSAQMQFCDKRGKGRDNSLCHHAKRGRRKLTGKKRKLEIAEGVVNILQYNVTTWSEHAKHYILTSDFDAALIPETHLERKKLVTAAKGARTFSWAGTGSAAISTANNGTSAGILALVRTRWFSKPLSVSTDQAGVLCSIPRLAGRVILVKGREILLFTAYFEDSVGFRRDINANLMQDVCFLTRDGKLPFILGADFSFSPNLWQWRQSLVTGSWEHQRSFQREPHTRAVQAKVKKPDIIDYFLVSTLIRPLIQKCEIVNSVPWGPHHGVKLTLNINFGSVVSRQLTGKISKRNRHNTNVLQGQSTQ